MKARTQQQKKVTLSIGMIVKNEENNLEKCLEGLTPLLNAVDSELIIVDTGSTDATMEIAARYTDKLYEFTWNDDFSAARNATMEHSSGQWYMYIDADEWLHDCDELIAFFNNEKELTENNSATFIIRNYIHWNMDEHQDFYAARIAKRLPGVQFESKVHEYLNRYGPTKTLYSFAHHFGYVKDVKEEKKKANRNLPILLGMWESGDMTNPAHTCFQISREYGALGELEKSTEFCREGIKHLRPDTNAIRCGLYHDLVMGLYFAHNWQELLDAAREYFDGKEVEYSTDLDVRYFSAGAYRKLSKMDESIAEYEEYFRLMKLDDEKKLNVEDRSSVTLFAMEEIYRNGARLEYADMIACARPDEALAMLDQMEGWNGIDAAQFAAVESTCVINSCDWDRYVRRYPQLLEDQEHYDTFCSCISSLMEQKEEAREGIAQAFLSLRDTKDPFVFLILVRGNISGILEELREEINSLPVTMQSLELLYYALQEKIDFEGYIQQIDADDLSPYIARFEALPELGEYVSQYYQAFPNPRTLPGHRWKCALLERILLQADASFENHMDDFKSFCGSLETLTKAIYGDQVSEEVMSVIPHGHRFGILMGRAWEAKKKGDIPLYLQILPKAGEAYPYFMSFAKQLVLEIHNLGEREKADQDERSGLIRQVKDKIQEVILTGDYETARKMLDQYKAYNPNDEDIPFIEMLMMDSPYVS